MQTERVTFLTTPDHKAALDAFAASNGKSVGHIVREATSRYITETAANDEALLAVLVEELEDALPHMQESMASIQQSIAEARAAIHDAIGSANATK